jgi:hypothetical protein
MAALHYRYHPSSIKRIIGRVLVARGFSRIFKLVRTYWSTVCEALPCIGRCFRHPDATDRRALDSAARGKKPKAQNHKKISASVACELDTGARNT